VLSQRYRFPPAQAGTKPLLLQTPSCARNLPTLDRHRREHTVGRAGACAVSGFAARWSWDRAGPAPFRGACEDRPTCATVDPYPETRRPGVRSQGRGSRRSSSPGRRGPCRACQWLWQTGAQAVTRESGAGHLGKMLPGDSTLPLNPSRMPGPKTSLQQPFGVQRLQLHIQEIAGDVPRLPFPDV
jgi:hypothetical protein